MSSLSHAVNTEFFEKHGYVIQKGLIAIEEVRRLKELSSRALTPLEGPVEFEAEVGYPGAPTSLDVKGGDTPRRLLHAYSRNIAFAQIATSPAISNTLVKLMDCDSILLSQNHHNCIMTKFPGYSSETNWHQDIRYWEFDRPELISIWCALGSETRENGALAVIPGSHKLLVERGRLDRDQFLRSELSVNQELMGQQTQVELDPGDVLFFHCRLFHAATRNLTDRVKLSAVFTYHAADNYPIPGTRSDRYPPIPLMEKN